MRRHAPAKQQLYTCTGSAAKQKHVIFKLACFSEVLVANSTASFRGPSVACRLAWDVLHLRAMQPIQSMQEILVWSTLPQNTACRQTLYAPLLT